MELSHPLSIPFPWRTNVNIYMEHAVHTYQDDITIGWNDKDQVQLCQENYIENQIALKKLKVKDFEQEENC